MAITELSDDDSISVTSTVDGGFTSDQEFVVERILAEKKQDDKPYYLIYWQGYPEEESTWEPEENIQDDTILDVWRARKARESSGLDEPYDLARFEAMIEKKQQEKAERYQRRRAKRIQLGLSVSESEAEDDDNDDSEPEAQNYSSDEAEEIFEDPVDDPGLKTGVTSNKERRNNLFQGNTPQSIHIRTLTATVPKTPLQRKEDRDVEDDSSFSGPDESLEDLLKNSEIKRQKRRGQTSISDPHSTGGRPKVTTTKKNLSTEYSSLEASALNKKTIRTAEKSSLVRADKKTSANINIQAEDLSIPRRRQQARGEQTARGGRVATRGGAAFSNVFAGHGRSKSAKKNLIEMASDPAKPMVHFKNLHLLRKAELYGRAVADAAPDISALPGGLFNPSNPVDYSALRPATLRKNSTTSVNKQDEEHSGRRESLTSENAVETQPVKETGEKPAESPPEEVDQDEPALNYASYELSRRLRPFQMVCYYWATWHNCKRGIECRYKHTFEGNSPVAPAVMPLAEIPCKYWSRGGSCPEGDRCRWLHAADIDQNQSGRIDQSQIRSQLRPTVPVKPRDVRDKPVRETRFEAFDQSPLNMRADPEREIRFETREQLSLETRELKSREMKEHSSSTTSEQPKQKSVRFTIHHSKYPTDGSKSPLSTTAKPKSILQKKRSNVDSSAEPSPSESQIRSDSQGYFPEVMMTDTTIFESPAQSPTTLQSILQEPKRAKTMSIEDYRRKSSLKVVETRAKRVKFGAGSEDLFELDFGEFGKSSEEPWAKSFALIDVLDFSHACTALDFQALMTPVLGRIYWQGSLSASPAISTVIDRVAQQLQLGSAGLLFVAPEFMILAYPLRWEDWRYIGGPTNLPADARLGYLIFEGRQILRDLIIKLSQSTRMPALPSGGLRYKKALMRAIHGLQIQTLLASPPKGTNPYNFFLIFPSTAKALEEFLASWLKGSKENCNVYSSSTEGGWLGFVNSSEIRSGVVLIHESAISTIDELPSLSRLLFTSRHISFWSVGDPTLRSAIYRNLAFEDDSLGKISVTRLFPLGGAVLITPSFLIAEPERAYQLLKWFQLKLRLTLGTWKLVCCNNLRDYLFDLACEKAAERDEFYELHKEKPAKDALAIKEGLSYQSCEARFMAHQEFIRLLAADADETFDEDNPKEETSPIVYADPSIDPDDEKALVTWYAAWAMSRLEQFRRFYVIGTNSNNVTNAVRVKEVIPKTKDSAPQVNKPAQRRNSQIERALAVASKLNALAPNLTDPPRNNQHTESHSTPRQEALWKGEPITPLNNGQQQSNIDSPSPINSERPAHTTLVESGGMEASSLNIGDAMDLDESISTIEEQLAVQDLSENNSDLGQGLKIKGLSKSRSEYSLKIKGLAAEKEQDAPTSQSSEMMEEGQIREDLEDHAKMKEAQPVLGNKPPKTQIRLEATTVWYGRLRAAGRGWEHLLVENWDKCFDQLGVKNE
ncbi:hypothetical protein B7463_g2795, partial [Scytalidium lignicola]